MSRGAVQGGDAAEGLLQGREVASKPGRREVRASNSQTPAPEAEGGRAEPAGRLRSHFLELLGHWSGKVIPRLPEVLKPRAKLPECQ